MPPDKESVDLNNLLANLGGSSDVIPYAQLYPLSDLPRHKRAEFGAAWDWLPLKQRRRVVHALASFAEERFEVNFDTIFTHCLNDPDGEIRAAAIDGLWESKNLALAGTFMTMLRSDPDPEVRAAAAAGLGRFVLAGELEEIDAAIQSRILTELLTTYHLADEIVEVRRRALESAAYACFDEVLELLDIAYFDDDPEMRTSAIVGMGRSCDRRWAGHILDELQSPDAAMRYEAALASGELGLRQAVPLLASLLEDPDNQVLVAAIHALGQIGGTQAKEVLLNAYDEASDEIQVAIDDALAEHALAEGDVDFYLYEVDEEPILDLDDDELYTLWSAVDLDEDDEDDDDYDDYDDDDDEDLDGWSLDDS